MPAIAAFFSTWKLQLAAAATIAAVAAIWAWINAVEAAAYAEAQAAQERVNLIATVENHKQEIERRNRLEAGLRARLLHERVIFSNAQTLKQEIANADDPIRAAFDSVRNAPAATAD